MGERTVTRWEPMTFANGEVEYVLWMKRSDGVEHYYRNASDFFEIVEEEPVNRDIDRYVVRCESFTDAARYAAEQNWSLHEWTWLPAYTISKNIQVFERMRDENSSNRV